jgi:GNAT superfamily N-acetyltransferase
MTVSLRPVKPSDRPFLLEVYSSTREQELTLVDWTADQKQAFCEMQFAAQDTYYRQNYAGATHHLILVDGKGAGRLYVARLANEILVVDIALLPAFRSRGVGSQLLRELQAEATRASKPLRIHVEHVNPARRLYDRLGFTVLEDQGIYLFMEWRPPSLDWAPGAQ